MYKNFKSMMIRIRLKLAIGEMAVGSVFSNFIGKD